MGRACGVAARLDPRVAGPDRHIDAPAVMPVIVRMMMLIIMHSRTRFIMVAGACARRDDVHRLLKQVRVAPIAQAEHAR